MVCEVYCRVARGHLSLNIGDHRFELQVEFKPEFFHTYLELTTQLKRPNASISAGF
jgi:oxalate decarboxylase/phosphoglucose isomerase-like protein (cupin superfamily)